MIGGIPELRGAAAGSDATHTDQTRVRFWPRPVRGGSLAERLQDALPDTRAVKPLNTMLFMVMTDPGSLATPPTAYPGRCGPSASGVPPVVNVSVSANGPPSDGEAKMSHILLTLLLTGFVRSRSQTTHFRKPAPPAT